MKRSFFRLLNIGIRVLRYEAHCNSISGCAKIDKMQSQRGFEG
jgi:hypothetical protein